MKNDTTKQFKIKKDDWLKIERIRLEISKENNTIISKMDTLTVVLDELLKKYCHV